MLNLDCCHDYMSSLTFAFDLVDMIHLGCLSDQIHGGGTWIVILTSHPLSRFVLIDILKVDCKQSYFGPFFHLYALVVCHECTALHCTAFQNNNLA